MVKHDNTSSIVFDIGGTYIRAGVYNHSGLQPYILKEMAPNFTKLENEEDLLYNLLVVITSMYNTLNEYYENETISQIGLSFPGPVKRNGEILNAPTLWGKDVCNFNIKDFIAQSFEGKNVYVINDITAAGWRYLEANRKDFCIITISSGVGCKVFKDGQVLLNSEAIGGELGHVFYRSKYLNIICDCGKNGHIGAISSGRGVENLARFLSIEMIDEFKHSSLYGSDLTTFSIVRAIKNEDEFALFILREAIRPIADAISFITLTIGIDDFIFVGGFFNAVKNRYISILKEEIINNGIMNMDNEMIGKMLHFGANDDNNGLIGIGRYINNIKQ